MELTGVDFYIVGETFTGEFHGVIEDFILVEVPAESNDNILTGHTRPQLA